MTHSYGVRKGTRSKFAKAFRAAGSIRIKKHLTTYKRGQLIDIIVDGAQHKGMPFQLYHGRTARVFNVNPNSIGISLHKQVRGKYVEKRLHVRPEHIRPSSCRAAFVLRVKENDKIKSLANKEKRRVSTKRQPVGPREAVLVQPKAVEFQHPKQFVQIV
ncbi:hypothetical protein pb186bvf_010995 [Paramecium bursaria]